MGEWNLGEMGERHGGMEFGGDGGLKFYCLLAAQ